MKQLSYKTRRSRRIVTDYFCLPTKEDGVFLCTVFVWLGPVFSFPVYGVTEDSFNGVVEFSLPSGAVLFPRLVSGSSISN